MLPVLLNTPRSQGEWDRWGFHHRASHDVIIQAVQSQLGVNLQSYVIDPVTLKQPKLWLEANQALHTDMDSVLGVQSSDLEDVNLSDQRQLEAWLYLHWQEHVTAEAKLKVAS